MSAEQSHDLERRRVLTGMRTTGKLHLGHYVGALQEWKDIQDGGKHEAFFLLANVQALTTHSDNPGMLSESVNEVVLDWMSVGLNPYSEKTHFVLQSHLSEKYELFSLLMMVAKHGEVMRNPTLKTELEKQSNATMGFMAYPVDEAADILIVSATPPRKGDELLVPAGEDQYPLLELTREIARRFNSQYGKVFVEPTGKTGRIGRLVGPDGQEKMGKSLGNAIYLSDTPEAVNSKVKKMYTDPKRLRSTDPGETDRNPVFVYLRAFASKPEDISQVAQLTEEYQRGRVGDVQVKAVLARVLNELLDPIRDQRSQLTNVNIREIVVEGTEVARQASRPVIESVREKMHLQFPK